MSKCIWMFLLFMPVYVAAAGTNHSAASSKISSDVTFAQWYSACKQHLLTTATPVDPSYFNGICQRFARAEISAAPDEFFDVEQPYTRSFYMKKIAINADQRVFFWGDIHGDIQALLRSLLLLYASGYIHDDFTLAPNCTCVFLGDYAGRGKCGLEVVYTLFRIKSANPDSVFLLRGNHEDRSMNAVDGFSSELETKLPGRKNIHDMLYNLYNLMPVALYIKAKAQGKERVLLCCHGAPELGVPAKEFITGNELYKEIQVVNRCRPLRRNSWLLPTSDVFIQKMLSFIAHNGDNQEPHLGFTWHDIADRGEQGIQDMPGRGLKLGCDVVRYLLDRDGVDLVVRGHQHNGMLLENLDQCKGCVNHWSSVITMLSSGGFDQDDFFCSFGHLAYEYGKWRVVHHHAEKETVIQELEQ